MMDEDAYVLLVCLKITQGACFFISAHIVGGLGVAALNNKKLPAMQPQHVETAKSFHARLLVSQNNGVEQTHAR